MPGYFEPKKGIPHGVHLGVSIASGLIIIAIWAALSYGKFVADEFLPTPTAVVRAAIEGFKDGSLLNHVRVSFMEVMLGFLLSTLIAVPMGILMGTFKVVDAAAEPVVNFFRYLPISALIPLVILWVGIGLEAKVTVIFLGTFFQQIIMISAVASSVQMDLINVSYTLGANRRVVLWRVLLPASLPGIFDALRVSMGLAWTYVVIAELVASTAGLGYMVLNAARGLYTDQIFVGIGVLGVLGMILDQLFRFMKNALLPWSTTP